MTEMKQFIGIFFILTFAMVSCTGEEGVAPDLSETEQTVFMYLPWAGEELLPYFRHNIADLESVVAKNGLVHEKLMVLFQATPAEAALFELKYSRGTCISDTLKKYTNPAVTTAGWITSILNDVKEYAPANRYAMIINCHGMGWIPASPQLRSATGEKEYWEYDGALLTRWFGGEAPYQTDVTTLAEGITDAGITMEYILFDDCYMSSIEVAYDLKEVAAHLIASPCEIMAYGMPYAEMAQYLFGKVDYEGISNTFLDFYRNYSLMPCGAIGVTVCSELDALAAVMKEINGKYTFDDAQRGAIQRMDGYTPVRFFDYGDYVAKLCRDEELTAKFNTQLERAIPSKYQKHTDDFYTAITRNRIKINAYSGVTTSDPSVSPHTSAKTETSWYKATH
ncbi:MAG: Clostripain family protein [Tannerellaceae bacterium]|jgi:hypothetical protein|nr:Clostripain family protein [Tannerellaceae bacterium]